jgi:glycosyltransferase involved in cell wall biosynthesis
MTPSPLLKPIRIAFCITELDPGGAERALTQIVLNLDRSVWEPYVICLGPRAHFVKELESANVPVFCLNAGGLLSLPRVMFRLTKHLLRIKPSITQTFLFHANILGRVAARLAGLKTVVSGLRVAERQSSWHGWIDRWTNWLVTMNVCVSQGVAEFSENVVGLNPAKLVVIPNSVDAELFSRATPADMTQFEIPAGSRVLISIGRIERQKGFDVLLDAVRSLKPLPDGVYLVIVGDGPDLGMLQEYAERYNLVDRVRFLGRRDDVPNLLAASTAFILSSRWEGMPNVVLEAMAAGLPVITTQVEGVSELIRDGVNGLTVPTEQPARLASAILQILSQPDFGKVAGLFSQNIVAKEFTIQRTTEAYAKLYLQLLQ